MPRGNSIVVMTGSVRTQLSVLKTRSAVSSSPAPWVGSRLERAVSARSFSSSAICSTCSKRGIISRWTWSTEQPQIESCGWFCIRSFQV
jgi:hypothetical protein